MKRDKWTQQLHDKLAEHETPAPADLWADIEAALPQQPRRARFVALHRWAAAASVAVLLGGGAMVWWGKTHPQETLPQPLPIGRGVDRPDNELSYGEDTQKQDEMLLAEALPAEALPADELPAEELPAEELPIKALPDNSQGAAAPRPSRGKATGRRPSVGNGVAESQGGVSNSNTHIAQAEMPTKEEKIQTPPPTPPLEGLGKAMERQPNVESVAAPQESIAELTAPLPHREGQGVGLQREGLHLSLYAMNGLSSQDNSNAVQMADALANSYDGTYAASLAASRQPTIWLAGYEERQHHRQPVAFGLTLSYPVTGRLSLVSGVVYTRLKSDFTQVIRSQHIFKEQMLHYVGIPLSASYRLWQHKGLKTYLSAGMQADWNVKAQLKTEGVEQEMGLDRLQWSVNASLGLQYDLLPQLSLYAEPGINHYFDNGSLVQNFFKDKPTSLKLQLGIRLNLQ